MNDDSSSIEDALGYEPPVLRDYGTVEELTLDPPGISISIIIP